MKNKVFSLLVYLNLLLLLLGTVQRDENANDNEGVADEQGKIFFSHSID
jgi:hypothetical protein